MAEIVMQPVDSSNVAAVGFDEDSQTLRVEFLNGRTYDYQGVSAQLFESFMQSPSKGRFVHAILKPSYPVSEV